MNWMFVVNFIAGTIALSMIGMYVRSNSIPTLRPLALFAAWNIFYFTFIYGIAMFGFVSSSTVTYMLRPFAGVLLILCGFPFLAVSIIHQLGKS